MKGYSTRQAAKKLGISFTSLNRYIAAKRIPVPPLVEVGSVNARLWTDQDVERIRIALPKIQNGRKTRHKKQKKTKQPRKRKS